MYWSMAEGCFCRMKRIFEILRSLKNARLILNSTHTPAHSAEILKAKSVALIYCYLLASIAPDGRFASLEKKNICEAIARKQTDACKNFVKLG